jgi:hypothetical protein
LPATEGLKQFLLEFLQTRAQGLLFLFLDGLLSTLFRSECRILLVGLLNFLGPSTQTKVPQTGRQLAPETGWLLRRFVDTSGVEDAVNLTLHSVGDLRDELAEFMLLVAGQEAAEVGLPFGSVRSSVSAWRHVELVVCLLV